MKYIIFILIIIKSKLQILARINIKYNKPVKIPIDILENDL